MFILVKITSHRQRERLFGKIGNMAALVYKDRMFGKRKGEFYLLYPTEFEKVRDIKGLKKSHKVDIRLLETNTPFSVENEISWQNQYNITRGRLKLAKESNE